MFLRLSVLGLLLSLFVSGESTDGAMKYSLDGMVAMMEGGGTFEDDLYDNFLTCFAQADDLLLETQDMLWTGMIEYAVMGGTDEDPWLDCVEADATGIADNYHFYEFNCTVQDQGNMPIYEPCDYASNVAYYHTSLELCAHSDWSMDYAYVAAMIQTMSYNAQGSSVYHGTDTSLGAAEDGHFNSLFTYVAYQGMISALDSDDPIITDLALEPRDMDVFEMIAFLRETFLTRPVTEWEAAIRSVQVPDIRISMCTFFSLVISTAVPDNDRVMEIAEGLLNLLGVYDDVPFCTDYYLPTVLNVTDSVQLTDDQIEEITNGIYGVAIKFIYAFIWQEEVFPDAAALFTPQVNNLGAHLLPLVNNFANSLLPSDAFPHFNPDFQHGVGVYPGEDRCNAEIPHAKWHVESAVALADFMHLADLTHKHILASMVNTGDSENSSAGARMASDIHLLSFSFIILLVVPFVKQGGIE